MNDTNTKTKCHFSGKCFYFGTVHHRLNECHNKKAAERKAKVAIDDEREQDNEQVEVAFDSTSRTDPKHICTIKNITFLHLLKINRLGTP